MGTKEKLREKLGREPTKEEIQKAKDKKEKKRAAEAAAEAAPAAAPAPAPATSQPPAKKAKKAAAAAAPAAAPNLLISGSKKQRKEPAAEKEASGSSAPLLLMGGAAESLFSGISIAAASAPKKRASSDDSFRAMWGPISKGAAALMESIEASLNALPVDRLGADERTALVATYREQLTLALTPTEEVLSACRAKVAARTPTKPPPAPKVPVIDESLRDEALALMASHDWDVMLAAGGGLTDKHLKHLALFKGVYDAACKLHPTGKPGKINLLTALLKADFKKDKKKSKSAPAAPPPPPADDSDDSDGSDGSDDSDDE